MSELIIRSGGQSGVDRAAIDVARARGLRTAGWCPHGGWAEDYPEPPGILANYPFFTETPSSDPEQRTAWNVRDSHATLILAPEGLARSPGTHFTFMCAKLVFLRPVLVIDPREQSAVSSAGRWLSRLAQAYDSPTFVINVAGPRESQSPGIGVSAFEFLDATLLSVA